MDVAKAVIAGAIFLSMQGIPIAEMTIQLGILRKTLKLRKNKAERQFNPVSVEIAVLLFMEAASSTLTKFF